VKIALSSEKTDKSSTPQRLGLILGLLVMAQFVVVVDFSIVQIALPTIRLDLSMSLADLQWIVSAYGLTFAGFLLLSGRLSDIYGRKRLFMIGLLVFSLSSLAGGLATSEAVLIAARVVQGIGAALASATGLALIIRIFAPLGRLNQALGIFTAVSSAGFSAGVILGGVLTQDLGWRWIFFVNVPIGIVVAALAIKFLPDSAGEKGARRSLDLPGAITVTGGLMLLVYALSEVGNGDSSYLTYLAFILAGVTLASFIAIEHRSAAPLMPLGFLGRRTIFFANATALLTFATNVSMVFLLTAYLQVLQSYSALSAAGALIPGALVFFFLGGFGAPRLVKRLGAKPVLVGAMVALSAGMLLFTRISLSSSYLTVILPALLVASVGGALALTASNIAALSGANRGEEGVASGLINTSRQVGGPVGLAVAVGVVGLATHGLGVSAPPGEVIAAFRYAFTAAAIFAALAVVTSLLLKGKPAQSNQAGPSVQVAPPPAEFVRIE
jgi:EmrB/QacA subfamily drug resistance transporter